LANHKSAIKRIRSSATKRMKNKVYTSRMRTELKKAKQLIASEDVEKAIEQTRLAISQLDKAAGKGIIHKNNAARKKSRLMKRLAELESQTSA